MSNLLDADPEGGQSCEACAGYITWHTCDYVWPYQCEGCGVTLGDARRERGTIRGRCCNCDGDVEARLKDAPLKIERYRPKESVVPEPERIDPASCVIVGCASGDTRMVEVIIPLSRWFGPRPVEPSPNEPSVMISPVCQFHADMLGTETIGFEIDRQLNRLPVVRLVR